MTSRHQEAIDLLEDLPAEARQALLTRERRVTLEAGHVILPGSVHRAIDAHAGDDFEAVFTDLGSVRLSFTE